MRIVGRDVAPLLPLFPPHYVSVPDIFREIIRYTVQGSRFKVERTRKQETGVRDQEEINYPIILYTLGSNLYS
jgi:hypothetical protein